MKELDGCLFIRTLCYNYAYLLNKSFVADSLLLEPEEYIHKNDPEVKESLALLDIMHKVIDETVLKICGDVADKVLKEN